MSFHNPFSFFTQTHECGNKICQNPFMIFLPTIRKYKIIKTNKSGNTFNLRMIEIDQSKKHLLKFCGQRQPSDHRVYYQGGEKTQISSTPICFYKAPGSVSFSRPHFALIKIQLLFVDLIHGKQKGCTTRNRNVISQGIFYYPMHNVLVILLKCLRVSQDMQ